MSVPLTPSSCCLPWLVGANTTGNELMRYSSILDTIGNTPLVELKSFSPRPGVQIFAKLEGVNPSGSIKDRIAKKMIEEAEASGRLTPGSILLEPTSGNTGIALAMIARVKGYPFIAVLPDNVTQERRQMLELYGARIILSDGTLGSNGAVKLAQDLASKDDRYVMLYQYGNDANPRAHYEGTALEIINDLPDLDVFVAGLGTGGTLTGNARRLKEYNPAIKIVAAEPLQGDAVQGLRSLEDGFVPPVLDQSLLDARILVSSRDAIRRTRQLKDQEGIFAGPSCGAALHAALRVAASMERGKIVVILADGGWKYLSEDLWTRDLDQLEDDLEAKLLW
jgi:[CysO sulfur-carrier protein]-thiocarboxylate-dependent cysteine synthase